MHFFFKRVICAVCISRGKRAGGRVTLSAYGFIHSGRSIFHLFNKLFNLEGDKAIDVKVRSDLFNIIKQEESIITGYDKDPEDEEVKDNG